MVAEAASPQTWRMSSSPKVLLAEGDIGVAGEIVDDLRDRGYDVTWREDGQAALDAACSTSYAALIVDCMLPSLDGLSIIERLREENRRIPVLVLSALATAHARVRGLKAGGDDYLTKPFAVEEIAARIDALLRRPLETRQTVLRAGTFELSLSTGRPDAMGS